MLWIGISPFPNKTKGPLSCEMYNGMVKITK